MVEPVKGYTGGIIYINITDTCSTKAYVWSCLGYSKILIPLSW